MRQTFMQIELLDSNTGEVLDCWHGLTDKGVSISSEETEKGIQKCVHFYDDENYPISLRVPDNVRFYISLVHYEDGKKVSN